MTHLIHALSVLLPLLYGASLVAYVDYFRTQVRRTGRVASWTLAAALIVDATYLLIKGFHTAHFPVTSPQESLGLLGFAIALIYFVTERSTRERNTGMFFASIVFFLQAVSSTFLWESGRQIHELLSNPIYGIHTTLTVFGVSALAVGGIYGLLYLMLSKQMKKQRFGVIYDRLPPLDMLETMANHATTSGLVILGGGLILGHVFALHTMGRFLPMDAKILLTDLTWFAYVAGYVWVRRSGWRGRRLGQFTFWAFVTYFSSMMVLNIFVSSFHRFA